MEWQPARVRGLSSSACRALARHLACRGLRSTLDWQPALKRSAEQLSTSLLGRVARMQKGAKQLAMVRLGQAGCLQKGAGQLAALFRELAASMQRG